MNDITGTMSTFNIKCSSIINQLEYVKKILVEQELDLFQIEEIREKLINNVFSIIVVGEFSSGKSTFINALLRKKLLPAKVLPTTAIINIIEDGQPEATVFYKDKQKKEIDIDAIQGFATALDDKGKIEAEKIDYMLIKYPCEYTKDGVRIIDTPGVEDLDKTREEITYEMIPKADAAILLLDARRALKNSEVIFLKEKILGNNINKLFFVLNFADAIRDENMNWSNEKLQVIVDKIQEELKLITGNQSVKIYDLSAKKALLESEKEIEGEFKEKFNNFERSLQDFLVTEKGQLLLSNTIFKTNLVLDDILRVIKFKINSLNKSLEELKIKEKRLIELISKIRNDKILIKQDVNRAFNEIMTIIEPEIESSVTKSISTIEGIEVPEMSGGIDSYYKSKFTEILDKEIDLSIKAKLQDSTKKIVLKVEKRLSGILNELSEFMSVSSSNDNFKSVDLGVTNNIDDKDILLKQLAMGAGAFVSVPLIAGILFTAHIIIIPVIIGYALSGMAIFKWGNNIKKNIIIKQIKDAKNDIINNINQQVRDNIVQAAKEYCEAIDNLIEVKIKDTSVSLSQVIKEKEKLSNKDEEMLKELIGNEHKINKIKLELKSIVEGEIL